jgi:hypothetical protein
MSTLKAPLLMSNNESQRNYGVSAGGVTNSGGDRERKPSLSKKDKLIRRRRSSALKLSLADDPLAYDKNNIFAGRIYASNAPKIVLETITARTSLLIIALTYIIFIVGFSIDIWTTYQSFTSSNYAISAYSCTDYPSNVFYSGQTVGCSQDNTWNATVTHLSNVLSVKLTVQQNNLTIAIPANASGSSFTVEYNVKLWACYEENGCGSSFKNDDTYTNDPSVWQKVLFLDDQNLEINLNTDEGNNDQGPFLNYYLITNTFQNQESIPTNGLVKSYFILVEYTSNQYNLFSGANTATQPYITYSFDVVMRPQQSAEDAITVVLLFLTIVLLGFYIDVLRKEKIVLSEQKWLVAYIILLIFFQNPVYCVIVWLSSSSGWTSSAAYTSYLINDIAQCGLFILWLLFADSLHRKTKDRYLFYGPKIFMGFLIFLTAVVILTFQFPGLQAASDQRDALVAVANWSNTLQLEFIVFTLSYLSLIWIWTFVWFARLYFTARKLKRLPYMSTRYIQLSFRFFSLQATLVTIYYVFQYAYVIYWISFSVSSNYDAASITDNINTLFRQQTQLFGKTLFLTVYAMILTFLFLPSSLFDPSSGNGLLASLAATYVISEEEHEKVVRYRKEVLQNMKRNVLNQVTLVNQLVSAKVDVFCVDLAIRLRDISFQVYYDLPEIATSSGSFLSFRRCYLISVCRLRGFSY